MEAVSKAKNRGSLTAPKFTPLSEAMNQGGGYKHGSPERGLSAQMMQGSGYKHPMPKSKLQTLMGQ